MKTRVIGIVICLIALTQNIWSFEDPSADFKDSTQTLDNTETLNPKFQIRNSEHKTISNRRSFGISILQMELVLSFGSRASRITITSMYSWACSMDSENFNRSLSGPRVSGAVAATAGFVQAGTFGIWQAPESIQNRSEFVIAGTTVDVLTVSRSIATKGASYVVKQYIKGEVQSYAIQKTSDATGIDPLALGGVVLLAGSINKGGGKQNFAEGGGLPGPLDKNKSAAGQIIGWGSGTKEALQRIKTIDIEDLKRKGLTKEKAKEWRDLYRKVSEENPKNPSALGRAVLMNQIYQLMGGTD